MNNIIVYFHGFGSSPSTDKVDMLREFGEVHAWPIDVDPRVSIPFLVDKIETLLLNNLHSSSSIVFVGTSLGAYYAQKLGRLFDVDTILINPSYTPRITLARYGVPDHIREEYDDMSFCKNDNIVIAKDDDVIDHDGRDFANAKQVIFFEEGGHRFNGSQFIQAIKQLHL